MKPIFRVQNVYDHMGRPKISIPKDLMKRWGFPKYVLIEYDPNEDVLKVRPYWGSEGRG